MRRPDNVPFWSYAGRFSLVHLASYSLVATVFLAVQRSLPAAERATLDHFALYRPFDVSSLTGQLLRGVVLAMVLYPFIAVVLRSMRGRLILFGALWGLAVVGSVEPMPGSIEGVLYVLSTPIEHGLVLAATAIQAAAFTGVFVAWQRHAVGASTDARPVLDGSTQPTTGGGFVTRFTVVHVVTYAVAGMVFFALQDYETLFATEEIFAHYRPLEGDPFVAAAIPAQLVRGSLLAVLILPFAGRFLRARHGWALLFLLLWGLTHVGSPLFLPDLALQAEGLSLQLLLVGTSEVTVQMLVFAALLFLWERRAARRRDLRRWASEPSQNAR